MPAALQKESLHIKANPKLHNRSRPSYMQVQHHTYQEFEYLILGKSLIVGIVHIIPKQKLPSILKAAHQNPPKGDIPYGLPSCCIAAIDVARA